MNLGRLGIAGLLTAQVASAAPVAAPSITVALPPVPAANTDQAVLEGLDKTTARVTRFTVPVGGSLRFGTLDVAVRDCRKQPPEEPPESAAYLDIDETRPGEAEPKHLFGGWMFASSPAVSALEHPVYDVWVVDCKIASGSSDKKG